MTVDITVTETIAITAAFVTGIIVKSVHRIVVFAKKHYVSAVVVNARIVKNWFVQTALAHAVNVMISVVKNV